MAPLMASAPSIAPAWLAMTAVAIVLVMLLPFLFGMIARKLLAVGWNFFWFGAIVFLVFQLLTRVPAVILLQVTVLGPLLRSSPTFTWIWLVLLAVTAGLFEEVGRYVGYRVLLRREAKTWSKAVMFGLGHEGLESLLLVGGQLLLMLVGLLLLAATSVNSLPAAERPIIVQQIAAINAQPAWLPLLTVWERLWSFPLQVALAVLVLQVFLRHQLRWLFLAILVHALIDFVVVALPQAFGQTTTITLLLEGILCGFGLLAVWISWRLREAGDRARDGTQPGSSGEESPPASYFGPRTSPQDVVPVEQAVA